MTLPDFRFGAILGCFFLSGAAGLVYQVTWSRRFGLVFGTAEVAIATVLAAFLGGLGIGAALAARHGHRIRRPLVVFGMLELTIGLTALAIPLALDLARHGYVALFGGADVPVAAGGAATTAFYLVVSLAILVIPTACMGATLPILTRFAVRSDAQVGPRVGLLYAANTAGAVLGAVATGFWLLPALGLARATWVAVGVNAMVFGLACLLGRASLSQTPADATATSSTEPDQQPPRSEENSARGKPSAATPALRRAVPWLVAVAGFLALGYEVLWTRLLSHAIGGSIEAFATMLASFLVGIAGGALIATRRASTPDASARGLIAAQIGAGVGALISFVAINALPGQIELIGGRGGAALAAGIALLPGALAMGATFPLAVRALAREASEASVAAARVYAWNTAGAVFGALAIGFLVLPALGFAGTLTMIAAGNLLLALVTALCAGPATRSHAGLALALLVALLVFRPATPWRLLRHAPLPQASHDVTATVAYHAVGRSATVLLLDHGSEWDLRTNGLPEGTIQPPGMATGRYLVTPWLGALPSMLRPETDRMLVIGLGAGVVLEAIPSTTSEIDLIEIEPEVIAANQAVADQRRYDPLADPRLRVITNDARSALLLTDRRYDAIVSQPSHPWTASGHLYTREFFGLVRDHLTPTGIFVQWIGLGALDEPLLTTVIATVTEAFPNAAVFWPPGGNALLLAASQQPLELPQGEALANGAFGSLGVLVPEDLAAALVLDDLGARRMAAGAGINTDNNNRLQARSAHLLGTGLGGKARTVLNQHDPWTDGVPPGLDVGRLIGRLLETGQHARGQHLLSRVRDPRDQLMGQALLARATGRPAVARSLVDTILANEPQDADARAVMLSVFRGALARDGAPPARLVPLTTEENIVVEGWRAARRGDLDALLELDSKLAGVAPIHPLYSEALRLRVAWRAHSSDPAQARAGQALLAILVSRGADSETALLTAHAAIGAGHRRAALATLETIARNLESGSSRLRTQAQHVFARLGPPQNATEEARLNALRAALEQP